MKQLEDRTILAMAEANQLRSSSTTVDSIDVPFSVLREAINTLMSASVEFNEQALRSKSQEKSDLFFNKKSSALSTALALMTSIAASRPDLLEDIS